ncbi:hypothetical protein J1614_011126 [Plenodomus biglobosus]|nr:hypothetical protein J1614_011126 [Plenodomus biglobosus]
MPAPEDSPALPTPPFYTIPNLHNFRDVALFPGLTTASGAKLRPGVFFRSAEVGGLDEEGWKAVAELGVRWVFDLRSGREVNAGWGGSGRVGGRKDDGDGKRAEGEENVKEKENGNEEEQRAKQKQAHLHAMAQANIHRTWAPVFKDADYSPENLAARYAKYMDESEQGFVHAYRDILGSAGPAFGTVLRFLADTSNNGTGSTSGTLPAETPTPTDNETTSTPANKEAAKPKPKPNAILIHCTAGKDRTGLLTALLLSFLGVPAEQIAGEYHLTDLGLAGMRESIVERLVAKVPDVAVSAPTAQQDGQLQATKRNAALRMISARRESMLGTLDMVEREFGGAEAYLREVCGLGESELAGLRRVMLVGCGS